MRELYQCIRAEFVKMRHTFLYPLHIAAPAIGSVLFLLYYRTASWSEAAQISGYAQVIGIALPFAVSIGCAGNVGLEEKNHFHPFLNGTVCKWNSFLGKYLALLGMGMAAVAAAVLCFAAGYGGLLGKEGISVLAYGALTVILCLGTIPLYMEHLFFNLMFSRTVSIGIGVIQFLLSALFLTGLGDGRWMFFPCTWSARGAALFLAQISYQVSDHASGKEKTAVFAAGQKGMPGVSFLLMSLLLTILICVIIRIWFHFYEGRQCND